MTPPRACELGIVGCRGCGLVMHDNLDDPTVAVRSCPRCGDTVHRRKSNSIARTWAFLLAAVALYVPANMLTIMRTTQFPVTRDDTILSGVRHLWLQGAWDIAAIVFVASIMVPLLKMIALGVLLVTTQRDSDWHRRDRTKLFRVLEFIGHWSMLDVFVVALLITLVQFGPFARVEAGPAIVPFGMVVVLTMLASLSFDPRLIWDRAPARVATVPRDLVRGLGGAR